MYILKHHSVLTSNSKDNIISIVITLSLSLSEKVVEKIDKERGEISRSRFVRKLLEGLLVEVNNS